MKFVFNFGLCTLNEYIEAERSNKYKAAKIKSSLTMMIKSRAKKQTKDILTDCYDCYVYWQTKDNRIDSDNVNFAIKFILDGIVVAERLKKDGRKNIRDIHHHIETTGTDKVIIVFKEINKREFVYE